MSTSIMLKARAFARALGVGRVSGLAGESNVSHLSLLSSCNADICLRAVIDYDSIP